LHDLLCRAADEARTKGIHAEHLLILLKDIWYGLPELNAVAATEHENTLLQQLISRCIQEYYAI
jgi:predicted component of type VI protein secretion system